MPLAKQNAQDRRSLPLSSPALPSYNDPTFNASYVLGYDGSDRLETVDVTLDGVTFRRTLTYTGDNLTGVSAWVEQ